MSIKCAASAAYRPLVARTAILSPAFRCSRILSTSCQQQTAPFCLSVRGSSRLQARALSPPLTPPYATMATSTQSHQNWASQPFALITDTGLAARPDVPRDHFVTKFTKSMALVHNLILRAFNASYNQCLAVSPGTAAAQDFLIFNQCIVQTLESHHDMEEEHLFPALEEALGKPGAMEGNRQEHKSFHDELMQFRDYVFTTDPKDYDGEALKGLIETLGPLVEKHLHNEIAPLYDLHVVESEALKTLWMNVSKSYQGDFDIYRRIPFSMTCTDKTFVLDGQVTPFFSFPAPLSYIAKFLLGGKYSGAWAFSPSDFKGRPRQKPYAAA